MSDPERIPGGPTGDVRGPSGGDNALEFRDPEKADALARRAEELVADIDADEVSIMHVCGSHEQSIAKFGLRSMLPDELDLRMGPGCPVCVTDMPEVDEAVALANAGLTIVTYGDMLHVPGTSLSLSDARDAGADVQIVYSAAEAAEIAEETDNHVVFFATGFETTAAPTAAVIRDDPPENFWVLSAHKYVPPAMEVVAAMPDTDVDGFLAAGNAATITGWGLFEELVEETDTPITVGGFEPLDILAGLVALLRDIRDREVTVRNAYPRCVTEQGNEPAQEQLWEVFTTESGEWRGIAHIPDANLILRDEYAHVDAREKFDIDTASLAASGSSLIDDCICGDIMAGREDPTDCEMFGEECTPEDPVGACMVSSEGTCKIWHEYGGRPDL
jgi:hydrogenase expression/formation protein HypD